ncbi:MAG: phenylalanine--tRNA ligase subunit beta [Fibrobacterota bacterium]
MKASLEWIENYTDLKGMKASEIGAVYTDIGLELEGMSGEFSPVPGLITAEIIEKKQHPGADRLSICSVDTGDGILEIVCGAPNAASGQKIIFAPEGTELPVGLKIKKAKIRGVESRGMICSLEELGLAEKSSGIMVLSPDTPIGVPVSAEVIGVSPVLELAVLPNRPDCLSVIGLAREINARLGGGLRIPETDLKKSAQKTTEKISVNIEAPDDCPRYTARFIKGVKPAPSPEWMVKRLESAGLRAINNIVDITNYVMLETGQPLHAFDYSNIRDSRINVRKAFEGEKFTALDGQKHILRSADLLICDGQGPVALAGIIGGLDSEVTDNTTDVLLESAFFNPVTVRLTSRKLGVSTESSYRFERGVDWENTPVALDRAASLIAELAGGEVFSGAVDEYPSERPCPVIDLRTEYINRLLGTGLKTSEIKGILESLYFTCEEHKNVLKVVVPSFRSFDITREADLAEEIARIYGYNNINTPDGFRIPYSLVPDESKTPESEAREFFRGEGFCEVLTNSLISPEECALTGNSEGLVSLLNPGSPGMSVLRPSLLPSLLNIIRNNRNRGTADVMIFESGRVYLYEKDSGKQPEETSVIAGCVTGRVYPADWKNPDMMHDFYTAKGSVERFLQRCRAKKIKFVNTDFPWGFGQKIYSGKTLIGELGEVNSGLLEEYGIDEKAAVFTLYAEELSFVSRNEVYYKPVSRFQSSQRDFSFVMDENAAAGAIIELIRGIDTLIEEVLLFDIYRGENLGTGKKSISLNVRIRSGEKTLKESEIDSISEKIILAAREKFGAELR